ncbi:MAG: hypothetical protein EBR74_04360 [Flavobacteriia bacterium]|nr:hypothetical protein [Flavobacteriia bacterium]
MWKIYFFICISFFSLEKISGQSVLQIEKRANLAFTNKSYDLARVDFQQLLARDPASIDYNFKYGVCLFYSDERLNSKKYFDFVAKQVNPPCENQYFIGKLHQTVYNFDKAISAFKVYLSCDPKDIKSATKEVAYCNNGKNLLGQPKSLAVKARTTVNQIGFQQKMDLDQIEGMVFTDVALQTKMDKKKNHVPTYYFKRGNKYKFFSSYGDVGSHLDLYYIEKITTDTWSTPKKIAGSISPPSDEDFPFYDVKHKMLYFSSNGFSSMGGFDLFKVEFDPETNVSGTVENMDFPYSSAADDVFFIPLDSLGKMASFATNRSVGVGKMEILKVQMSNVPNEMVLIQGQLKDKVDVKNFNMQITVLDETDGTVYGPFTSDESGKYLLSLPGAGKYTFTATINGTQKIFKDAKQIPTQKSNVVFKQVLDYAMVESEEYVKFSYDFNGGMDEGLSSLKYNAMANLNTNQRLAKVAKSNEDKTETDEINPASLENDLLALGFAQKGIVNQADALSEKLLEISMIGEDLFDDIEVLKSDEKGFQVIQNKLESEINTLSEKSKNEKNTYLQSYYNALIQKKQDSLARISTTLLAFEQTLLQKNEALAQWKLGNNEAKANELSDKIKLQSLQANEDSLRNVLQSNKEAITQLIQSTQKNTSQTKTTVPNYQGDLATMKAEQVSLEKDLETMENRKAALSSQLPNATKKDKQSLTLQISELENKIKDTKTLLELKKDEIISLTMVSEVEKERNKILSFHGMEDFSFEKSVPFTAANNEKFQALVALQSQVNSSQTAPSKNQVNGLKALEAFPESTEKLEAQREIIRAEIASLKQNINTGSEEDKERVAEQIQKYEGELDAIQQRETAYLATQNVQQPKDTVPVATNDPTKTTAQVPVVTNDPTKTTVQDPVATNDPTKTSAQDPIATNDPTKTSAQDPVATNDPTKTTTQNPIATNDPTKTSAQDPVAMNDPTKTSSQDPVATNDPTKSSAQDPVATNDPAKSTTQDPIASNDPTKSSVQDPVATNDPTKTSTQDPVSTNDPTKTSAQDPVATNDPTNTTTQDPVATNDPTKSSAQDPVVTNDPTKTTAQDPVSTNDPTKTTAQDPVATNDPIGLKTQGEPIQNGNDEFNENQIAQENNPDPNVESGQGKENQSNPSDVPFEGSNSQKGMASVTMHNEEWVADHEEKIKALDQKKEAIEGLQSTEKDADKLRVLNALAQQNRLAFQVLRLSENLTDSVFAEIFSPQELQRWNLAEINALQNIKSDDSLGSKVNAENVLVVSSTPESKVRDEKRNAVFDTTSVSMEAQQELKVDPAYSLYVSERKALVELDKNKQNQEKELMLIKSKYIRALNNDVSKEDLLVLENQLKDLAVKGLQIQALLDRRIEKIQSFEKHLAFSTLISRNIAPEVGGKVEQPVMAANMAFSINEQNNFPVNQAFPVTDKMPNGLIFRVQVGAFREAVPSYFFREFSPVSGEKRPNGLTCYMAGYFVASNEAFVAQKNIRTAGYADAYLVAYCDGKRISIQEGLVLEKNGTCTKRNADEVFAEVSAIYNGSIQTDAPVLNVPKEIYYTVQVAAIKTPIKAGQLKDIPDLIYNLSKTGMYKYSSGKFLDVNEAKKRKNEIQAMGITDAYIVAYRDGLPISFAEAALAINHLNKQQPAPIENSVVEAQDLTGTSRVLLENLPQIVFQKSVAQYKRMDFEYLNQFESFVFDSIKKTYETNPLDVSMISPLEYIYYADMTATSIDSNANDLLKITVPKNNMKEAVMHDFALHANIPYVLQRTEPGLSFSFTPRNEKERSQLETIAQTNQFEINIPLK